MRETSNDSAALDRLIRDFIEGHLAVAANNNLGRESQEKAWDGFLLGYSSGADELYAFLKQHIGEFHWTPAEAFALGRSPEASPDSPEPPSPSPVIPDEDLTVISCALLQTEATKAANRLETRWPSEPWARARIYGQRCVRGLQQALVKALEAGGYEAVAPALLPACTQKASPRYGDAYPWSERHVAYISGLGTFGLSGGLITERGKAHRLASVVVRAKLEPTARPYDDPFAYCLHYRTGACAECAARCPVGSISPNGRDKPACAKHLTPGTVDYVKEHYGFDGYGCGLCQTAVPCESRIPARPRD
jgi:epoxyqueuosine reductase